MSTRRNGGIIGPQNRTTSVVAPGVWHLDDNQESISARNWPGIPSTVPNAPALGTVTLSGTTATIPFTLGFNGGSAITSVTAIIYPGGTLTTITGSPPSSPITVTGLGFGTYYFAVYATNANGNSTYSISNTISISNVNYLAVAGGGGGGYNDAGGGGAGGLLSGNVTFKTGTTYTITVGAGGSGSASTGNNSTSGLVGSNSTISGSDITTITAVGGGGGAAFYTNAATSGGSGGGGSYWFAGANGTTGQGYAGGTGGNVTTGYYIGGGGGGAGAVGGNASTTPGLGGIGYSSSITGSSIYYAGGGGGGGDNRTTTGSVNFNGSTDYLYTSTNAGFGMGTGDFTIEFWTYWGGTLNIVNGGTFIDLRSSVAAEATAIYLSLTGVIYFFDGPANVEVSSGVTITAQWTHIALTRQSGVWKIFINGSLSASRTSSSDLGSSKPCLIGIAQNGTTTCYNGYISNVRIIKGTAIYTNSFTPPTSPLPVVSNMQLLTCLGTGFFDASSNNLTISLGGSPKNNTNSPFTSNTANITGALGGTGGGGTGAGPSANATTGTVNTGGGGGGGAYLNKLSASGGSGVVIISLPTGAYTGNVTGAPTVTTSGGNTVIKFTGNGTYTA